MVSLLMEVLVMDGGIWIGIVTHTSIYNTKRVTPASQTVKVILRSITTLAEIQRLPTKCMTLQQQIAFQ